MRTMKVKPMIWRPRLAAYQANIRSQK